MLLSKDVDLLGKGVSQESNHAIDAADGDFDEFLSRCTRFNGHFWRSCDPAQCFLKLLQMPMTGYR